MTSGDATVDSLLWIICCSKPVIYLLRSSTFYCSIGASLSLYVKASFTLSTDILEGSESAKYKTRFGKCLVSPISLRKFLLPSQSSPWIHSTKSSSIIVTEPAGNYLSKLSFIIFLCFLNSLTIFIIILWHSSSSFLSRSFYGPLVFFAIPIVWGGKPKSLSKVAT